MDRLLLVVGAVAVAGVVAALVGRRRPSPPADNTGHIPRRLDRADFDGPGAPWLVAVFTSAGCNTCAGVVERALPLASDQLTVQEVELGADPQLHDRYRIDAVPTLVLADADGAVRTAFLGPVATDELWAAVADARDVS